MFLLPAFNSHNLPYFSTLEDDPVVVEVTGDVADNAFMGTKGSDNKLYCSARSKLNDDNQNYCVDMAGIIYFHYCAYSEGFESPPF